MTPEQIQKINDCAAEVARKRLTVDAFMQCNVYGHSVDQSIEFQQKKSLARAALIEAENALDAVMPKRT